MGRIHILDEALASQIAAGEVVERPASVVKELVENALDAGAARVDVSVAEGGMAHITVVDDGAGMAPDDAVLCFSRHATSKLATVSDLARLLTFGFRGEALAAIASVAKVRLVTRSRAEESASEVRVDGGRVAHVGEAGAPVGTAIEVAELFFNVPARRKFLKSERTEVAHILDALKACALGQPALALSLTVDGRRALEVSAAPAGAALDHPRRVERAVACLGEPARELLFPLDVATELLRVTGYVVAPTETRRDLSGLHLSVNGRPVADRALAQAVRVAFRTLLEPGRQPVCALDLAIAPELVDVNVHPRKAEVRFTEPRRVHGHLIRSLADFLTTTPWLAPGAKRRSYVLRTAAGAPAVDDDGDLSAVHRARVRQAVRALQARDGDVGATAGARAPISSLRRLGQVGEAYLVLEGDDGLVVVDQHAAMERVAYERLRAGVERGRAPSQPLLFPTQVSLSPLELAALEEHGAALVRCGLEVEPFGDDAAMVRAVPCGLDAGRADEMVKGALLELALPSPADNVLLRVCARLARSASAALGQALPDDDVGALLAALDELDLDDQRPLGRPLLRALPFDELGRWFERR